MSTSYLYIVRTSFFSSSEGVTDALNFLLRPFHGRLSGGAAQAQAHCQGSHWLPQQQPQQPKFLRQSKRISLSTLPCCAVRPGNDVGGLRPKSVEGLGATNGGTPEVKQSRPQHAAGVAATGATRDRPPGALQRCGYCKEGCGSMYEAIYVRPPCLFVGQGTAVCIASLLLSYLINTTVQYARTLYALLYCNVFVLCCTNVGSRL